MDSKELREISEVAGYDKHTMKKMIRRRNVRAHNYLRHQKTHPEGMMIDRLKKKPYKRERVNPWSETE